MTYASRAANVSGRASAAPVGKSLLVSRTQKRNTRSTSYNLATCEPHKMGLTRGGILGKEDFEEMFMVSRSKFVAMAQAILRNREDAEDAVQNAFLSAHLHLRSFEGRSALRTWLTRIVLNAALMIQRKRKSTPVRLLTDTNLSHDTDWLESIPAAQADPEMIHGERETLELINRILRKMKPTLRQAFTMTYFDEMSNREASGLIGVPEGTFKARLFRARRYLANHAPYPLLAPPRGRAAWTFSSSGKDDSQALATRPTEISSLEAALS